MEDLAELTDWGFWANLAEVITFVVLAVGAFFGYLWKTGRWLFAKPPVVIAPPPPTTTLIGLPDAVTVYGRRDEVADIRRRLLSDPQHKLALVNSGAVLAGQGGIGKTTLARFYATTYADQYDSILWTLAAARQDVINGLCAACPSLGLETPFQPQIHHAQQVVAGIASSERRWLVIFDNVEDRAHLEGLVPAGAHVLVTTRQGQGWPGWQPVQTEVLAFDTPEAPAVQMLMTETGRTDDPEAAQALAGDLGGLPLALRVMAGYLRDQGIGFAMGRARLAEVLTLAPPNAGYPDSLMGALRLSYDRLGEDAQTLARLCAYWAGEGLGPWLLLDAPGGQFWGAGLDLIPAPVQALAQDAARVRAGFAALAGRSLITGTGDDRQMHRMTAACLRVLDKAELAPAATALLAAVYPGGEQSPAFSPHWPLCARLTPHVTALRASGAAPKGAAWDYLLNQAGVYLDAIADYAGALPLADETLASKKARGAPESDRVIAVGHANLGMAHRRLRDWVRAEAELGRALALLEAHWPGTEDHADTLTLLGGLMLDLARSGQTDRMDRARRLYQQALAIRRRVASRRSEAVAQALNNLGAVRFQQGRVRAAARLYGAALTLWRGLLPEEDSRLGLSAMNVGSTWLRAGDPAKAEPLLREALAILARVHADRRTHPHRRDAAGWLIACLLVRARAGVNRGMKEAEAKTLCEKHGFDYEAEVIHAADYPLTPP